VLLAYKEVDRFLDDLGLDVLILDEGSTFAIYPAFIIDHRALNGQDTSLVCLHVLSNHSQLAVGINVKLVFFDHRKIFDKELALLLYLHLNQ